MTRPRGRLRRPREAIVAIEIPAVHNIYHVDVSGIAEPRYGRSRLW